MDVHQTPSALHSTANYSNEWWLMGAGKHILSTTKVIYKAAWITFTG